MDELSALSGGCNGVSDAGIIGRHRDGEHYSYFTVLHSFDSRSIDMIFYTEAKSMTLLHRAMKRRSRRSQASLTSWKSLSPRSLSVNRSPKRNLPRSRASLTKNRCAKQQRAKKLELINLNKKNYAYSLLSS